jgi:hypothetical protein
VFECGIVCGNGTCEEGETEENCAADCVVACVNDDSTTDTWGDTCSSWYDSHDYPGSYGCNGGYNDDDFDASVQCCVCQGAESSGHDGIVHVSSPNYEKLDEAKAFALANPDWDPTPSSDSSREDCGGTGPNTGCDDVCFSGLVDDECGLCNGDGVAAACGCTDTSGLNDEGCCDAVVKDCNDVCGGDWQEDCSEQCRSAFWFGLQGNGSCV